jgi:hypothetical protein
MDCRDPVRAVVDQHAADAHGRCGTFHRELLHGHERVGLDDRRVLGLQAERLITSPTASSAGTERSSSGRTLAGARPAVALSPLLGRQSALRLGSAGRPARGPSRALDPHRQVQVGHQAADDEQLLDVLAPEVGDVGDHHAQQLDHDCRDAAEMPRSAHLALERLAQVCDLDGRGEARRIDLLGSRREQEIRAGGAGEARVAGLVARIALQTGELVELGGVDEQRDDDHLALLAAVRTSEMRPS